jgi:hypothetical protein
LSGPPKADPAELQPSLQAFGLVLQTDNAPDAHLVELWTENEPAVALFARLLTQWRMGPGGPVGLDYTPLPMLLDMLRVRKRDRQAAFDGLREMESEGLRWLAEQRGR